MVEPSGGGAAHAKKPAYELLSYISFRGDKGTGKDEVNEEEQKLQNALNAAIVREKPNVKWADVAGLDQAKASL